MKSDVLFIQSWILHLEVPRFPFNSQAIYFYAEGIPRFPDCPTFRFAQAPGDLRGILGSRLARLGANSARSFCAGNWGNPYNNLAWKARTWNNSSLLANCAAAKPASQVATPNGRSAKPGTL